jgi:hypothetical protein
MCEERCTGKEDVTVESCASEGTGSWEGQNWLRKKAFDERIADKRFCGG